MEQKTILITGASSGIGKSCADFFASKGYRIYGTTRNKDNLKDFDGGNISMIFMDVTDPDSIRNAVSAIIAKTGSIDVLINNAGMGMAGSIEDSSYEDVLKQFDTNTFGSISVINEVLPHMRKNGSGRIINIGSVAAYISIPFQAVYSATKAAMTSLSYSLRNETAPYGIKVSIVHPGDLKTNFTANRKSTEKSKSGSVYEKRMKASIAIMEKDEQNGGDPVCVAKTIHRILKRKNPPVAVTVGLKYKIISFLFRIVPAKLRESLIASLYA